MMVVVAKKIDWLTVDLYVPVMLMDYSLMNSGSYTCNKSEGLISLSNLKNSFCSSFIRIDFTIYHKYLKEITENGAYYQVAWQKLSDGYVALYGTTPIQIRSLQTLNDIFEDEEG